MLPEGAIVLAMVSGGADSTALLRLLAAGELGEVELSVLHVDHMLRGEDSDADAAFVTATCAALGVPCRVVRYDVAAYAGELGLNLEDAGRRVRYRFAEEELDALCDAAGRNRLAGRIATAHTLDDAVETFLMRALEGAGAGGFAGVPPKRGRVVRPLVEATREQVVGHLESLGQVWREDATNADTARLRSRIRHDIVPALEAVRPRFRDNLARSLRLLAEDDALLSEMADAFGRDFSRLDPGGLLLFDRPLMNTLSPPMARRTVRAALIAAFPEASRLESAHVDRLVEGLAEDRFAHDLPGGLHARCESGALVIRRAADAPAPLEPVVLEVPGTADLGAAGRITASEAGPGEPHTDPDSAMLDAARLTLPLVVDAPRPGDRIRPLGMEGTKKVGDLMTDAKVPERLRPVTPVVRSGELVVWVAGLRISEDSKVTPETRDAVLLRWQRADGDGAPGAIE